MKCDEYHRDMSDRAPPWSWASVEGPVKFGFINETNDLPRKPNLRLRFGECTINTRGFNFTGEVESDGVGGGKEVSALRGFNRRLVQKASPLPSIANRPHRDLKPRVGIK
jgi:hypothetical protein